MAAFVKETIILASIRNNHFKVFLIARNTEDKQIRLTGGMEAPCSQGGCGPYRCSGGLPVLASENCEESQVIVAEALSQCFPTFQISIPRKTSTHHKDQHDEHDEHDPLCLLVSSLNKALTREDLKSGNPKEFLATHRI